MKTTKILVIRIRRVGDAILSESVCKTLKQSIPNSEIHYLVYDFIGDLFESDPYIDKIIRIDHQESHQLKKYIKFAWNTVHAEKYDIIIDLRSTISTLLFSLFSIKTKERIGVKKWYNRFILNRRIERDNSLTYIPQKLSLLQPLQSNFDIVDNPNFEVFISDAEKSSFRKKMSEAGIDFTQPIMVATLSTRIALKQWPLEYMEEILTRVKEKYPHVQVILHTALKEDKSISLDMFEKLNKPSHFFTNIRPNNLRQLAAMVANCNLIFGNEGDARLLAQSQGTASLVYFHPGSSYKQWLPNSPELNKVLTHEDIYDAKQIKKLAYRDLIYAVTPDIAWQELNECLKSISQRN